MMAINYRFILRWFSTWLLFVLFIGVLGPSVGVAQVLDQIYDGGDEAFGNRGASESRIAQTFTVGIAGELGIVSVALLSNSPFDAEIRRVVEGVPSNKPDDILALIERVDPVQGDWTDMDFSDANISVSPGHQLAVVLARTFANGDISWRSGFGPTVPFPEINALADYEGGDGFLANLRGDMTWRSAGSVDFPEIDLYFRTFVHPVPEPRANSLVLFAMFGFCRWRRQNLVC